MAEQAVSNGCGGAEQPPTETIAASSQGDRWSADNPPNIAAWSQRAARAPSRLATLMIISLQLLRRARVLGVHGRFRQVSENLLWRGRSTGTIPMLKSLLVAAVLTTGLANYAFAQSTVTGAPAGTAPETPAPGTPAPIPGVNPAPTGSHQSQMRHRANRSRERARASAHHMRHKATATPAT
jgi:hypothetical protein